MTVIESKGSFQLAFFEYVISVKEKERKSGCEIGDELIRERAESRLNIGRKFPIVILFIAQSPQQIAHWR